VYRAVARWSAHELSHDKVVNEWCIASPRLGEPNTKVHIRTVEAPRTQRSQGPDEGGRYECRQVLRGMSQSAGCDFFDIS